MAESKIDAFVKAIKTRFSGIDFVMIGDDSGSEGWPKTDNPPADSRFESVWAEQTHAMQLVAEQATAVDEDGVVVAYINSEKRLLLVPGSDLTAEQARYGIKPSAGTHLWVPMRNEIDAWLKSYDENKAAGKPTKDCVLLIFTDGEPGSTAVKYEEAKEKVYLEVVHLHEELSKRGLTRKNFSIQMIQVGKMPNATKFLTACDDDLAARCEGQDYVDTTKFDASMDPSDMDLTILKILYGSVAADLDGDSLQKIAKTLRAQAAAKTA